ncbi:hypothetical protein NDO71_orf186 [Klebsiella phage vB_KpnM_NDO71]|nr:hypothetical protein NDO71_orf186 [Klebsiella phage vB_KpnM_NDO71]
MLTLVNVWDKIPAHCQVKQKTTQNEVNRMTTKITVTYYIDSGKLNAMYTLRRPEFLEQKGLKVIKVMKRKKG